MPNSMQALISVSLVAFLVGCLAAAIPRDAPGDSPSPFAPNAYSMAAPDICKSELAIVFTPLDGGQFISNPWQTTPLELMRKDMHPYARALETPGTCFEASYGDQSRWASEVEAQSANGVNAGIVAFENRQFRVADPA